MPERVRKMALNAKTKKDGLWASNWKCDSERQTEIMAPSAERNKYMIVRSAELETNKSFEC